MSYIFKPITLLIIGFLTFDCNVPEKEITCNKFATNQLKEIEPQVKLLIEPAYKANQIPCSEISEGAIEFTRPDFDWKEGGFPCICWYLYQHNSEEEYRNAARYFQIKFVEHRKFTNNHDLGFV